MPLQDPAPEWPARCSFVTRTPVAKRKRPAPPTTSQGAPVDTARKWLAARNIEDIECILPDQAGGARGTMMPGPKLLEAPTMTMPGSILTQTIAAEYPDDDEQYQADRADQDIHLEPDFSTLSVVPW